MDLERGASDVGEDFVPQIEAGYFAPLDAPTEVSWWKTWQLGDSFFVLKKNLACV